MFDEVFDRLPQPGVEVGEARPLLPAWRREVMNHHHVAAREVPTRNIVVVLAPSERNETPIRVALTQARHSIPEQISIKDPPRLKVGQPELNRTDELSGILESLWEVDNRQ